MVEFFRMHRPFFICAVLAAALFLGACSSDHNRPAALAGNPMPTSTTYVGTQVPGDLWTIALGSGTFNAANNVSGLAYSGTFHLLDNGFLEFTTTSTNDTAVTAPLNSFGVLAADNVLVFEPPGAHRQMVFSVPIGSCPSGNSTVAWNVIAFPTTNWNSSLAAYSTAITTTNGATLTDAFSDMSLSGTQENTSGSAQFTCSDGIFTSGNFTLVESVGGQARITDIAGDDPTKDSSFNGLVAPSANLTLGSLTSQQYIGVVSTINLDGSGSGDENTFSAAPNGNGALTTVPIDPSSGTPTGAATAITFSGQPSAGLLTASLVSNGGASFPGVFIANQVAGRFILVGMFFNASTKQAGNMVFVQEP